VPVGSAAVAAPRILLLSAPYGSGHDAAAQALAAAFTAAGALPRVVDHFVQLVDPRFAAVTRALYNAVLRHARPLWRAAYALGDWLDPSSPAALNANRLGSANLERLLRAEAPDAVVCTHPTPAGAVAALRARGVTTPEVTLVFTDFAAHSQYIQPGIDWYCVPAPSIKHELVARGVSPERVVVTGIPVHHEFSAPLDRRTARAALGIDADRFVVLAMAGTLAWMGRLPAVTRTLLAMPPRVHGIVVAGRDSALQARLQRMVTSAEDRVRVLGYASNVRTLMAAADVLVTKAGGITLAEALAAGVPTICFGSLPGHETRNEGLLTANGGTLPARSTIELERALRAVVADPTILPMLQPGIRALRRPDASRDIVAHVLHGAARDHPAVDAPAASVLALAR
jgi:processive 1,2-diacylglycerol beta-glucosyltransferase